MVGDVLTGSTSHDWIERKIAQTGFPAVSSRLGPKRGRISLLMQGLFVCRSGAKNYCSHVVMATTCNFSMSHEAALQNWRHFSSIVSFSQVFSKLFILAGCTLIK